jgi:hypothetical protein
MSVLRHDIIEGIDGSFHDMKTIDHLNRLAKEVLDGRRIRFGHIQYHDFNPLEFGLRTTLEPGDEC